MIQQVVLDRAEVCSIIANHVAENLPEGTKAQVVLWGKHEKKPAKRSSDYIREKYVGKLKEKEDLRLIDVGAVVTFGT